LAKIWFVVNPGASVAMSAGSNLEVETAVDPWIEGKVECALKFKLCFI